MTDKEILEKYGFTIICESPFEISNEVNEKAEWELAYMVLDHCKYFLNKDDE